MSSATLHGDWDVTVETSRVRKTKWQQYAIRFLFGGLITAVVGVLGKAYGPVVAGLFLAFPAILPASVTLVASHDGERAAGADSVGAAIGSSGLIVFGLVVWALASRWPAWAVLVLATAVWFIVSVGIWAAFELVRHRRRVG